MKNLLISNGVKKISLIIFLFSFLAINQIQAAGLVPCGGEGEEPCQLCHFFVLFSNIVRFVLFDIVPPLAVLMIIIGGLLYFFAGSNPQMLNWAKSIFTSVVWGLLIIFAAWILVNTFFMYIGVASWTGLKTGWFKIECP